MWRRRTRVLELAAALLGMAITPPASAAHSLLLALSINGLAPERVAEVLQLDDGGLALTSADWRELALTPVPALQHEGRSFHRLADAGVLSRLDERAQRLDLQVPAAAFGQHQLSAAAPPPATQLATETGATLAYDVQTLHERGWQRTQALLEAGVFGAGGGDLRQSGLWRPGQPGVPRWTRLDTTWTLDQPGQMASLRLGDTISQPGSWGQAVRFAGVQWRSDFALRPGFIPYPLPSLQGQATLPSTVDLYVDNSRRLQSQLPAGAFELSELPVVNGQGEMRLVVRDLLGREQVLQQSYHVSTALLRPGLREQSFELGRLRLGYGLAGDRYGDWLLGATDRVGVSETFSRELRAEVQPGQQTLGASGVWLLPGWGTLQLGAAASGGEAGNGAFWQVALERPSRYFSGALRARGGSADFVQAGVPVALALRREVALALGTQLGGVGLGFSLVDRQRWRGERVRFAALNASADLGAWGALGVFVQHDRMRGQFTVALSLSRALGPRDSVAGSVQHVQGDERATAQLQWQRAVPDGPGVGGRVAADAGAESARRAVADGVWNTSWASLNAGVAERPGSHAWRAGASGGVAWLGGSVHAARQMSGSFALVEVGGYPGVPVLLENRVVAHTDAEGRAVVVGLRAHEAQRIAVDPVALPMDAEVESIERVVVPPARSGLRLVVPVRPSRPLRFRLVDRAGQPLPAGTRLLFDGVMHALPLGFDGLAFTTLAAANTRLDAQWGGQHCTARLGAAVAANDAVADLGTVVCE